MSFYSGDFGRKVPGNITGSALDGLAERACIEAFKVLDAGSIQQQNADKLIQITNTEPANPAQPLTFVDGFSATSTASIANLTVTRFADRPNYARITANVIVPIIINFLDANDVPGKGYATGVYPFDVVMYVGPESQTPIEVHASANIKILNAEYEGNNVFKCNECGNIILRTGVEAQLLIPCYGYSHVPPALEYNNNICEKFFNQPFYPERDCNQQENRRR